MANPTNVVLQSGEATPANVVLRSRPGPLATAALVIVTLFAGEATPSNVVLRQGPVRIAQTATTLANATVAATGTVTGGGGGVNGTLNVTLADVTLAGTGTVPVQAVLRANPELVFNGDMELTTGWASVNTPSVNQRSTDQAHGGTYSRKVVTAGLNEGIRCDDYTTQDGLTYTVSFWIYSDNIADNAVIAVSGDGAHFPIANGLGGSNNTWTYFSYSYTESFAGDTGYVIIRAGGAGTTFYVDDVSFGAGVVLDAVTLAGTGTVSSSSATGTLAQTLADLTLAGTGTNLVTGTLAQTLADLTLAGTATHPVLGTLSSTLADATLAGTATHPVLGTLNSTLEAATLAGAGIVSVPVTLTATGIPSATAFGSTYLDLGPAPLGYLGGPRMAAWYDL